MATLSPADSAYHAWIQNWSGEAFRALVSTLGHDLDEVAGAPSPTLTERGGRSDGVAYSITRSASCMICWGMR